METIGRFAGQYHMFSNFARYPIFGDWPTNEHWFQAMKSLDPEIREKIKAARTPSDAKGLGGPRGIVKLRPDWELIKKGMLDLAQTEKFAPETANAELLLSTGNLILIEGNTWHDNTWGNCICGKRAKCAAPGENLLGRSLMRRRNTLQKL